MGKSNEYEYTTQNAIPSNKKNERKKVKQIKEIREKNYTKGNGYARIMTVCRKGKQTMKISKSSKSKYTPSTLNTVPTQWGMKRRKAKLSCIIGFHKRTVHRMNTKTQNRISKIRGCH